jgi:hypothetical protein
MEEQNIIIRFYEGILGIPQTWKVVKVTLEYAAETHLCPVCGKPVKLYDHGIKEVAVFGHLRLQNDTGSGGSAGSVPGASCATA